MRWRVDGMRGPGAETYEGRYARGKDERECGRGRESGVGESHGKGARKKERGGGKRGKQGRDEIRETDGSEAEWAGIEGSRNEARREDAGKGWE